MSDAGLGPMNATHHEVHNALLSHGHAAATTFRRKTNALFPSPLEAGIGKTTFFQEFAFQPGIQVSEGLALPGQSGSGYNFAAFSVMRFSKRLPNGALHRA